MADSLTRVQKEVLDAIVRETETRGPLMVGQIQELMARDPRHTLRELLRLGYLSQTIKGGPYIPTMNSNGQELSLILKAKT